MECGVAVAPSQEETLSVCSRPYRVRCLRGGGLQGVQGMQRSESKPGTHPDERITAARLDRDATRVIEPGAAAGAVEVATRAAAGERGGRPGGDFDTADPVVGSVLRCIMKGHAEEELKRSSGRAVCGGNRCYAPTPCARRVLCRLRDGGMRGYGGGRRTATSAKVPLGSIATPCG